MNTVHVYRVGLIAARHAHEYAMYLVPVVIEGSRIVLLSTCGFVIFIGGIVLLYWMGEHDGH